MPTLAPPVAGWVPSLATRSGPRYLALVDELAHDVTRGVLRAGDRLPPQRELADRLGVNLATITRAIAEAERRGLVRGEPGRGTFIADPSRRPAANGPVDLTINTPPVLATVDLGASFAETTARLLRGHGAAAHLRYPELGGSHADRASMAGWLRLRGLVIGPDHLVLTNGADHALQLALAALAGSPRRRVIVEELSYPGFRTAAAQLGLAVDTVPCDAEGPDPSALAAIAGRGAVACCITPVIHNPTGRSFSPRRVAQLVEVAQQHDVVFIEDDVYGFLSSTAQPPLAAVVPERAVYLTSFSKTFAPGLRLGFLAAASDALADRIGTAARATTQTPAPLVSAVATLWINDGTAESALEAVRDELRLRNEIADDVLGDGLARAGREAPHRWLRLPDGWRRGEFIDRARRAGVVVRASDAFAAGVPPEAVRISISAAEGADQLRGALMRLARLLREPHDVVQAVM